MRYDVIVSGAGPAGSTTARECASQGLTVLMLDKLEFPRDKPCGGAVSIKAADLLPMDISPVVERVISKVRFTMQRSHGFNRSFPKTVAYLTQRSNLDTFLAEWASSTGVIFHQKEPVKEVERRSTHVLVRTKDTCYEGQILVAADGVNGQTAKMAGLDMRFMYGIAMEGNISPPGGVPAEWQDMMGFDFGGLPGGYGWNFPKKNHLNIGLGGWRYIGPKLKDQLELLVQHYGFDPSTMWGVRGYHLPLRQNDSPLADDNILVVGDAAGLIDPLTGEGIFSALSSGKAAAGQITALLSRNVKNLNGYNRELESTLVPELRVSRQIHDIYHLWPGLFLGIERRRSILWTTMAKLLRGELTYVSLVEKLGPASPILQFISDLIRVAPPLRHFSGLRHPTNPERFFCRRTQSHIL